jgi:CheY-like chemotaxis protein
MNAAILLVDDDTIVLTLIHHMMHEVAPDYELLSVVNGAAALALIAERPVALVITDQHMPNMDGIAMTVAIKAVALHCPVILITGSPTREIHQRGQAAGVDYFLPKPFRVEQFAAVVLTALGR